MIQREILTVGGKAFAKTWSDRGKMIERDGVFYEEAIDPVEFARSYTETDEEIVLTEEVLAVLEKYGYE